MADLRFDFTSAGAERLKSDLRGVSDTSALAARGARLLSDTLAKQSAAARAAAGASLSLARADKILTAAEAELAASAGEAGREMRDLAAAELAAAAAARGITVRVSTGAALADVTALRDRIRALGIADIADVNVPRAQVVSQLAVLKRLIAQSGIATVVQDAGAGAAAGTLRQQADAAAAAIGIRSAAAAMAADAKAAADATAKTGLFTDAISKGLPVWTAGAGRFGLLGGGVQLFGGALAGIGIPKILAAASGLHLMAEAVIETGGTLIPAAVAFGAFGVAAVPTVKDLYQQMSALHTVTQAYGQQVYPLTGGFSKMAAAVQPQVYTLLGEGLVFAGRAGGAMTVLATGAGKVLDDLGARFVYATTQGKGFSTFARKAVTDLQGWGTGIGNLGGIIGNVLKVLPGYAGIVLNVFGSVSHAIETLTGSGIGQRILSVGLAAHGALIYIGLLGTGFAKLAAGALAGTAALALRGATALEGLGAAGAAASGGLLAVGGAAESAAALPWGWISIAAAGIGFLAYQLLTARTAAQQFNAGIQSALQNATLGNLGATLSSAIGQTAARYAAATAQVAVSGAQLTKVVASQGQTVTGAASRFGAAYTPALNKATYATLNATEAQGQYRQGLQQLLGQQSLVVSRVAALSGQYGGQASALALLNGAGITAAQITSTNAQTWAEAQIEVAAYNDTLTATATRTGTLGGALNALSFAAGDSKNKLGQTVSAMTSVTQAEDALLNTILGGEQAFIGYQQGIAQTGTDAQVAGAKLSGLNAQSLTLAADYYSTVIPNLLKLSDSLQLMATPAAQFQAVMATGAGQALAFAGSNTEARTVLVDLINNALGPGTVSLQNLNTWVKHNSTSLQGMNADVAIATVNASSLAGVLEQDLNAQFRQMLLVTSGASSELKTYTAFLTSNSEQTTAGLASRQRLIQDLVNSGLSARQATDYVNGLQRQIDGLKGKSVSVGVNATASGAISIVGSGWAAGQGGIRFHAARGGIVPPGMGTPGTDSVLVLTKPGEIFVPPEKGPLLAPALKAAGIPGFAGGGIAGLEQFLPTVSPAAGAFAGTDSDRAVTAGIGEAVAAAKKEVQAKAAAQSAMSATTSLLAGALGSGPTSGSAAVAQAFAKSILWAYGWSAAQWPYELALWNRESSWNAYAVNPSSGAAGIPQNINGWAAYRPGDYQAQVRWGDAYVSGRYGTPAAAWGHEVAFNWYGDGTSSARPGWAVVGERGRELVRFRGGEQVLPAAGAAGDRVIRVQLDITGGDQELVTLLRKIVKVKGGGNVQAALGRN